MKPEVGCIRGVFTSAEVDELLKICSKIDNQKNTSSDFRAYTNGFTENDLVYKLIDKKIGQKLNQALGITFKTYIGMFLKELYPWEIHTDYVKGDNVPNLAVLIPLKILPSNNSITHTVIFNEECTTTFQDFIEKNNVVKNNAVHIHQTHMSHCNPKELEYVTLAGAYRWQPGDVYYWDRKLLHASDNFIKHGTTEKQALVLFG